MCVVASKLVQVTENALNISHLKQCNSTIRYLQDTPHLHLRMCKLDPETLDVCVYTDASFFANSEHLSQLGYIVLLEDKPENACILHNASYKSSREARSVLVAETYVFADTFYFSNCAKRDLAKLLDRRVSLSMSTDSKDLFDVVTKCSHTQKRHLMIDLQTIREPLIIVTRPTVDL